MKQIRILLLLVVACLTTCAFAQQSIPDYIKKAQADLTKYYPQFKDYFEPIFAEYKGLGDNAMHIFNSKIHENFDIFEEDLTTERDKCATILTALDDCLGDKTFMKSKKQVDSPDGEDLINIIAGEITADIKVQFVRDFRTSEEELAKGKERLSRADERLLRADERLLRTKKVKETIIASNNLEQVLLAIEDLLEIEDISRVKDDSVFQEIIKYYISIGKKINHKPSAIGQKFIDEYNRINKE